MYHNIRELKCLTSRRGFLLFDQAEIWQELFFYGLNHSKKCRGKKNFEVEKAVKSCTTQIYIYYIPKDITR